MDEAYINLLGGIYKVAVVDDFKEVLIRARIKLSGNGVNKENIDKYLKENEEMIKNEVRKNVYQESRNFGGDTRRIQETNIRELVEEIVCDFKNQGLGVK